MLNKLYLMMNVESWFLSQMNLIFQLQFGWLIVQTLLSLWRLIVPRLESPTLMSTLLAVTSSSIGWGVAQHKCSHPLAATVFAPGGWHLAWRLSMSVRVRAMWHVDLFFSKWKRSFHDNEAERLVSYRMEGSLSISFYYSLFVTDMLQHTGNTSCFSAVAAVRCNA